MNLYSLDVNFIQFSTALDRREPKQVATRIEFVKLFVNNIVTVHAEYKSLDPSRDLDLVLQTGCSNTIFQRTKSINHVISS